MNRATFTGNLVRDPETKVMTNGKARCVFTLAVQRDYRNAQGNQDADFIQIIAFDKRAETAQKYLSKGRKVLVDTHVKTGSYEKDGRRVYTTEFTLDRLEFLSPMQQGEQEEARAGGEEPSYPDYGAGFTPVDDEELPF